MKRITISIDDDIYTSLVEYAKDSSKDELEPYSTSRVVRRLLANKLKELGYYPLTKKNHQ